jgi:antirestriction protein ArdC
MKNDAQETFDLITRNIIAELQNGVRPWKQTWSEYGGSALPKNALTGKTYQGGNIPLLWGSALAEEFSVHSWLTLNQAKKAGGTPIEGEAPFKVVKFGYAPIRDPKNKEIVLATIPYLKAFEVYNVNQIDYLPDAYYDRPTLNPTERNAQIEALISGLSLKMRERKAPGYVEKTGEIGIPAMGAFESEHAYYTALFNLIANWSLGKDRLDVNLQKKYGTRAMAFQAITCELASAFLCAQYGYDVTEYRHSAAIDVWIDVLKSDSKAFMSAAALAGRIVRFVHGEEKPKPKREKKEAVMKKAKLAAGAHA